MRNQPFKRLPAVAGVQDVNEDSPSANSTTENVTPTAFSDFPSSKKNDDESPTMRKSIVAMRCLNLARWFSYVRMLASAKKRRLIWSISLLSLLATTVNMFIPSRPRGIKVTSEDSHNLTNIHKGRRILQLGPTKVVRRQRNNKEWMFFKGSGDVTEVTSVQSPLPAMGARKVLEQDHLSHQETSGDKKSSEKRREAESREYRSNRADLLETETCQAQYEWQLHYRPNCNHLMEQDLTRVGVVDEDGHSYVRFLAHGYFRDVWKLQDRNAGPEKTALKTLRYEHDFTDRHFDRHRRDAVTMEQLTSSPWVVDIYGFCGNSGIFEYADGGSLEDTIFYDDDDDKKEWSSSERVVVAYQIASGLAAIHNYHKEGVAAIAHTDIGSPQYVYFKSSKSYKLNDFNRCRFLTWNNQTNEACPFEIGNSPGKGRSPEEYAYDWETEKIDVYSMGNIFYEIMTGYDVFHDVKTKKAQSMVKKGSRPKISSTILNSPDPFDQALLHATRRCWEHDPKIRASAREIQRYLEDTLTKLRVQK